MPESSAERDLVRVSRAQFLAAAAGLLLLDAVAGLAVRGRLLATWQGAEPLAPLYAFLDPRLRPGACLFALAAAGLVLLAPRLADPARTGRGAFAASLLVASTLLPLALFLARSDLGDLGSQFDTYRNEEFLHDARRIEDLPGFLEAYVRIQPELSLHGRHFPPGNAVLLYFVALRFGDGALAAGVLVLAAASAGAALAWRAIARIAGEAAGRQGALLLLAAPSFLDFACSSMDAVFLAAATLAWLAALRAAEPGARASRAWLAGGALLLATCFSFSAIPVGLAIVLHAAISGRGAPAVVATRLASLAGGFATAALALYAATGFPIGTCFLRARESADALLARAAGGEPWALWPAISLGNAVAFAVGSGLGILAALLARARVRREAGEPWTAAAVLALLAMTLGGIYHLETERIWLFAIPWVAAVAVSGGPLEGRSLQRVLALGLAQALLLETMLFTLW